jgi:membrane associated rhomboid family serine protease
MTELAVICKHCGAEVSPYITECPYCGQRLRKRAPKLRQEGEEERLAPKPSRFRRPRKRRRADEDRPLSWLSTERRYGTIALIAAAGVVYLVVQASNLSFRDVGAVFGPLDQDWWRLGAAQFVYDNVGYMLAVGIAIGVFGSSLEGRYGLAVPIAIFLAAGAVGIYLVDQLEDFPIAFGGNGSALGLACAWLVRDLRDRRSGYDTESDLLGFAVIAAVIAAMPLLETTASEAVAAGGAATGALLGLALPQRR